MNEDHRRVNSQLSRVERMFPGFHPVMNRDETNFENTTAKNEKENESMIQTKPDSAYTAADVYHEDIKEKKACINHSFVTKNGSKAPTKKQFDEMCKEICSIKLGSRISWEEFNKCSSDLQKMYINDLLTKYPGIKAGELAEMMGCPVTRIRKYLKKIGISIGKGTPKSEEESRKLFAKEVLGKEIINEEHVEEVPVASETSDTSNNIEAIAEDVIVNSIDISCDASKISEILNKFGVSGKVKVHIEKI